MGYPRFQRARAFKFINYTTGDITISSTTFATVSTALDLTLEAQIGDAVEFGFNLQWNNGTPTGNLDIATVVAGSPVNYFSGGATYGIGSGRGAGSAYAPVGGSYMKTLVAGDVSSGLVVVRLMARIEAAGAKAITANTTLPLHLWLKNLGPVDPN